MFIFKDFWFWALVVSIVLIIISIVVLNADHSAFLGISSTIIAGISFPVFFVGTLATGLDFNYKDSIHDRNIIIKTLESSKDLDVIQDNIAKGKAFNDSLRPFKKVSKDTKIYFIYHYIPEAEKIDYIPESMLDINTYVILKEK